jgi:hypothetical protein
MHQQTSLTERFILYVFIIERSLRQKLPRISRPKLHLFQLITIKRLQSLAQFQQAIKFLLRLGAPVAVVCTIQDMASAVQVVLVDIPNQQLLRQVAQRLSLLLLVKAVKHLT